MTSNPNPNPTHAAPRPDPTPRDTAREGDGRPHILVLGCGFGGMAFCKRFRGDARITVVDRQNHHLFQPLLYQVAMAALSAPEIAEPIRAIFRGRKDIDVVMDDVVGIDLDRREVRLSRETHRYDYLVIAVGGVTSYFGNDEWEEHAPGLKTLSDAFRIRRQMLTCFELAEQADTKEQKRRLTTTVVIGGGPTGVELAGSMADLTRGIFRRDFRHIEPEDSRIILIDGGDRLLRTYPEDLSAAAKRQLEEMGVEVWLGERVTDIREGVVDLKSGKRIEASNLLWGGGVVGNPLVESLDAAKGEGGRLVVEGDLSLPGYKEVFAVGDVASAKGADGEAVPGVAPAALQMGKHVAKVIRAELRGEKEGRERFVYKDRGSMATIGRSRAVAWLWNRVELTGFLAWQAWLWVHLSFLIGFRNKLVTLVMWVYQYVTFRAGARVIAEGAGAGGANAARSPRGGPEVDLK